MCFSKSLSRTVPAFIITKRASKLNHSVFQNKKIAQLAVFSAALLHVGCVVSIEQGFQQALKLPLAQTLV